MVDGAPGWVPFTIYDSRLARLGGDEMGRWRRLPLTVATRNGRWILNTPQQEARMAVLSKGGTPVLGLDIGAAFIKAVELRPSKGALAITGVGILPTPPGCIVNDEIVDPVVLAAAVKQVLAESNIKTKNVIASVAGQSSVVVRVIEVPKMT